MIRYFKMKKQEIQLKTMLYGYILNFIEEKEDILKMIGNLADALKDIPAEDLQERLIEHIISRIDEDKE